MKGLRIDFQGDKARIDFKHPLETTIDCLAQNGVVNVGTIAGSDKAFPNKGTNLKQQIFSGLAYSENAAGHLGNFAAVDTRNFANSALPENITEKLATFKLEVTGVTDDNRGWVYKASVQSTAGTESTVTWTVS
ncbi:MAG: hypothetical protein EBY39_10595 [Flavobacteriia bacterium]|nr:hypothetical protein [Flavobacteriia bacterium]